MKAEGYVQVGQPGTLKVGKQSYCLDKGDWVLKEYAKQVEPTFGACAIRDFK
ncbi:MAG: hypothetical protein LBB05_04370 [Puniceicoccales bacterium]|jgi:hypothetical protein|nr:hypothetical protein [Puniceicoccales bacterium]